MVLYNMNNMLMNTLKCSQRRGIFRGVVGVFSSSVNPKYLHSSSFSTRDSATVLYCKCLSRNYGVPTKQTIIPPSITTIRTCANTPNCENNNKKPSLYQRLKKMYRDYWYVAIPVHMITSAAWFGSCFYLASSGVDIVALLESLNVPEKILDLLRNGHKNTGYLAIALVLYKLLTPLRYGVTLGATTLSINYLKKWGYIKPVPSKQQLKEMYKGKKEIIKEKGQSMMNSLKQTASKKPPSQ